MTMAIKINAGGITKRLESIRVAMDADKVRYVPRPRAKPIEMDLEGKSVESLFHPSGLLIRENRPVFAYIPDNYFAGAYGYGMRKLHFSYCTTLQKMKRSGRWDRYRITNRDDDRYHINTRGGAMEARLYPCKNCLNKVAYKCFSYDLPGQQQGEIVKSFNAKEALDLLRQQFDIFRSQSASLNRAGMPTGYARNNADISRAYRAGKNFTCEKCGVNLNHARQCTDAHHISGVKNNNRYENLQCLCKLCHAKEHPHYRNNAERYRHIIEQARRVQGITKP